MFVTGKRFRSFMNQVYDNLRLRADFQRDVNKKFEDSFDIQLDVIRELENRVDRLSDKIDELAIKLGA